MENHLSCCQQKKGQKLYLFFCIFNGIAVTFVAENILILYSLKLNIPDYIIGIMSSFIFMASPLMFLGRIFIRKYGAGKTISIAWILRYLFAVLLLLAPFLTTSFSLSVGTAVVLIGAFGFYAFKSLGLVAWTPLLGEITSEQERGGFISKGFFCFTLSYFISLCGLRFFLEYYDSISAFRNIIFAGALIGLVSAYLVNKIPETDTPKLSAGHSLGEALKDIAGNRPITVLIIIQTLYFSAISLVAPFAMLALKEGYHVADYSAASYMLLQLLGGVTISLLCRKLLDKLGPKYIIISLFSLFMLCSFLWFLAPVRFYWWYCMLIFFPVGLARIGGFLTLAHYFLLITPSEKRVGITLFISVISSTVAGVVGALVGGGILRKLEENGFHSLTLYHYYFMIILLFLTFCFIVILYLERVNPLKTLKLARKIVIYSKQNGYKKSEVNIEES